jgi:hypothetical protein
MRTFIAAIVLLSSMGTGFAQSGVAPTHPDSTGRTLSPDTKGQMQPQGPTGPINTENTGGAPAESPQGQTPPGMQAAPEGSSKTIVDPPKK